MAREIWMKIGHKFPSTCPRVFWYIFFGHQRIPSFISGLCLSTIVVITGIIHKFTNHSLRQNMLFGAAKSLRKWSHPPAAHSALCPSWALSYPSISLPTLHSSSSDRAMVRAIFRPLLWYGRNNLPKKSNPIKTERVINSVTWLNLIISRHPARASPASTIQIFCSRFRTTSHGQCEFEVVFFLGNGRS